MSVTTANAAERPPHLLSQPANPNPSFSLPHTQDGRPDMADTADVDMTTSLTLTPLGQNHDREAVDMDIDTALPDGSSDAPDEAEDEAPGARNDAMDTSPDQPRETMANTQTSPTETSTTDQQLSNNSEQNEAQNPQATAEDSPPRIPPQDPPEPTPQEPNTATLATPASPQPTEQQPQEPEGENEESSSEDENMSHSWHEIQEDMSEPDEKELKEIEASGEVGALDHKHWEEKTFVEVKDPEHKPGASGHFEWTVEHFNGTKDNPNKEIVMRSGIHRIGGFDWQIKFYPRGNDSDYVSVYVDNLTVNGRDDPDSKSPPPAPRPSPAKKNAARTSKKAKTKPKTLPKGNTSQEYLKTPLPLLDRTPIPKRRSVAAQISVVMYNPAEPRVHTHHAAQHRFCPQSPDWGWTRYYGPHYEIQFRQRGQRQAMLRNDKLALTAYVRIVDDVTDCLWEHTTAANPWNSFNMTGIRGLKATGSWMPGGNLIAAVSSWLLFKPFRTMLYEAKAPNSFADGYVRPKPMLLAFQRVLYGLRHRDSQPVCLDPIFDAFRWYDISTDIRHLDPLQILDILRTKLQDELNGTRFEGSLTKFFGTPKDKATGRPSYRISSKEHKSIRGAFENGATDIVDPIESPEILQLEIQRQEFDTEQRVWKKVVDKVKLDDYIAHPQGTYVLYGFIAHKDHLQSGEFYSVLRPNGPGTKWFQFLDSKTNNQVHCLTKKQAIDGHEGRSPQNHEKQHSPVAHVVFYIREDVSKLLFHSTAYEDWDVPANVKAVGEAKESDALIDSRLTVSGQDSKSADPLKGLQPQLLRIFDAAKFDKHEGPGFVNVFEYNASTDGVYAIEIQPKWEQKDIQKELAKIVPGVKHPRQCEYYYWYAAGIHQIAHYTSLNAMDDEYENGYANGEYICSTIQARPSAIPILWLYIVPEERLHKAPPEEIMSDAVDQPSQPERATSASLNETENAPNGETGGDTPMSDGGDNAIVDAPAVVVETASNGQNNGSEPPSNADSEMTGIQDHPPTEVTELPDRPASAQSNTSDDDMVFMTEEPESNILFKRFDPSTQRLSAVGSFWLEIKKPIYETVLKLMEWEEGTTFRVYEEVDGLADHAQEVANIAPKSTKTFEQLNLPEIGILIVQKTPSDEGKESLLTQGKFSDPVTYLRHYYLCENFPTLSSGRVILDYFTQEQYDGEILHGLPHGQGTKIYHNNTAYTGTFCLGQRHGHGTMTYSTGDTYTGSWSHGLRSGHGEYLEAATGNKYIGNWKEDKKSGEGTTYWKQHASDERMCRVCWEAVADTAFYDCGHVVACMECAGQVENCPVCRKRVLARLRLYFVA